MYKLVTEPHFARRNGIKKISCMWVDSVNHSFISHELVSNAYNIDVAYLNRKPEEIPQELYDEAVAMAKDMMGGEIMTTQQFCDKFGLQSHKQPV